MQGDFLSCIMIGPFTNSNLAEGVWENQRRQVMRTCRRWQGNCGYLWCIHLCNLLLCLWQDEDMLSANYSNLSLLLVPTWAVSHWWSQWMRNCTLLVTYEGLDGLPVCTMYIRHRAKRYFLTEGQCEWTQGTLSHLTTRLKSKSITGEKGVQNIFVQKHFYFWNDGGFTRRSPCQVNVMFITY